MFRFPAYFNADWAKQNAELIRKAAVVDVETTGLSYEDDQIIEIGVRLIKFNRSTGEILALEQTYSGFQDPGIPLSEEVKELTGITDEMLKGQKIDWSQVNGLLESTQIVIAHNAGFDRPFIDRMCEASRSKIWGCSLKQIDWSVKALPSQKLDILSVFHGFFNDSHRALSDVDSLVYLLSLKDQTIGSPYLLEMLNLAKKPSVHIQAVGAAFDTKDLLKARNYRWDADARCWSKGITPEELEAEIEWMKEEIYHGAFRGKYTEIAPVDLFKANA